MQAYWTEQLAPLCPSPDDLAISTRSIRDFDIGGGEKEEAGAFDVVMSVCGVSHVSCAVSTIYI